MKRAEIVTRIRSITKSLESIAKGVENHDMQSYDVVCAMGAQNYRIELLLNKIGPKKGGDKLASDDV